MTTRSSKSWLGVLAPAARFVTLAALAWPLCFCTTTRVITTQPKTVVLVKDARGNPVADAEVTLFWWSYPHQRMHAMTRFRTDASGQLRLAGETKTERVMPLCMHGVPQHMYTFCATKQGVGEAKGGWRPKKGGDVALTLGSKKGDHFDCANLAKAYARQTKPKAKAKP